MLVTKSGGRESEIETSLAVCRRFLLWNTLRSKSIIRTKNPEEKNPYHDVAFIHFL